MAQFADSGILQRVSEAPCKLHANWREGISLEARSGRTLDELRDRCVADRLALGRDARRCARLLHGLNPPMYRDAISRYYYSLYHAFRAVAHFANDGDDYEEHSKLPTGIPDDFPGADSWRNDLKMARLTRNRADYNAYPKTQRAWRSDCEQIAPISLTAIEACRDFLSSRGCRYL